jgi:hypothetical protein
MIATIIAMSVIMLLAVVAVAAVNGDTHLSRNDLDHKQAYEAAKAGIDDYAFHLNADSSYWTKCTNVPTPNAVNQQGSTAKRRSVPGSTGATYAIELIPATGHSSCDPTNTTTATASMIEQSVNAGSFRIRSTGFSGNAKVSIVATFKPPSFLDYMYFTQHETSDPVTYGYPNPSAALDGANSQCNLLWQTGRYNNPIPGSGGDYCDKISFISGDTINGPLYTDDALAICGHPTFGRSSLDMIEVGAPSPGWYSTCSGSSPNFVGNYVPGAGQLHPPSSGTSTLQNVVQSTFNYTGQVRICLNGTSMTVGTGSTCTGKYSGPIPSNGVVYVDNGSCSTAYTPFNVTYPSTSGCGNAYVSGSYSGQLTIAAKNDIIVNGNLTNSGGGLLGLIADNFVRVYHPCSNGNNQSGSMTDPEIDAAILAIAHSFIVDNYNCGNQLGTLTVDGAIAQDFRGPVGTYGGYGGGTGYSKNYVYDDRLRYLEPPYFLAPEGASWVIGRETIG